MGIRLDKAVVVLFASLLLGAPAPTQADELYTHNEAAIVKVECDKGSGSATRVGKNTYISVSHVTDSGNCKVDGQHIIVTYNNTQKDFSTFLGPSSDAVIRISCAGFKHGELYVARGYAFGDSSAWFQPLLAVTTWKGFMTFVGDVFPGMSGGPILDKQGRITGTVNIRNPSGGVDLSQTPVCK